MHAQGRRRQRGVTAIQVAMVMPTVLFLLMLVVQFAFYEFAEQITTDAAQTGLVAATVQNGTAAAGQSAAEAVVSRAGGLLANPVVPPPSVRGATVTVSVSGTAIDVVPGLSLPVTGTATGPMEPQP